MRSKIKGKNNSQDGENETLLPPKKFKIPQSSFNSFRKYPFEIVAVHEVESR
jgi:hypothetical protein